MTEPSWTTLGLDHGLSLSPPTHDQLSPPEDVSASDTIPDARTFSFSSSTGRTQVGSNAGTSMERSGGPDVGRQRQQQGDGYAAPAPAYVVPCRGSESDATQRS
jgi:hypothetical protein